MYITCMKHCMADYSYMACTCMCDPWRLHFRVYAAIGQLKFKFWRQSFFVLDLGISMLKLMCKQDCCIARGLHCAQHPTTSVSHGACQVYPQLAPVLRQYFGYEEFRPGQINAILVVLHGHDVFVWMVTGSGKSLCMQWRI